MNAPVIAPHTTVNEVLRQHPGAVSVFHRLGIDACCGGARSLHEVAIRHRVDLAALLAELATAVAARTSGVG
jgi:regulator of cell morphogenesis and NO signaling